MESENPVDENKEQQQAFDSDEAEEVIPDVKSFQTSSMDQSPELKSYLDEMISNPFNNFCIDCKQNKTTHAIIWLGAFICADCAKALVKA